MEVIHGNQEPDAYRKSRPLPILHVNGSPRRRAREKRVSFSDSSEPLDFSEPEVNVDQLDFPQNRRKSLSLFFRRKSDGSSPLKSLTLPQESPQQVPIRILVIPPTPDGLLPYSPEIEPALPVKEYPSATGRKIAGRNKTKLHSGKPKDTERTSPDVELKNLRKALKQSKLERKQNKSNESSISNSTTGLKLGMWERIRLRMGPTLLKTKTLSDDISDLLAEDPSETTTPSSEEDRFSDSLSETKWESTKQQSVTSTSFDRNSQRQFDAICDDPMDIDCFSHEDGSYQQVLGPNVVVESYEENNMEFNS